MTGKPKNEGYSRGMYRTHIQLDQYELNDRLKMTKKKEVSLVFYSGQVKNGRLGSWWTVKLESNLIGQSRIELNGPKGCKGLKMDGP